MCVYLFYPLFSPEWWNKHDMQKGCSKDPSLPNSSSKLLTMVMVLGMPMPKAWNSNGMDIDTWSQRGVQVKSPILIEPHKNRQSIAWKVVTIG